jgi:hypothetical protein
MMKFTSRIRHVPPTSTLGHISPSQRLYAQQFAQYFRFLGPINDCDRGTASPAGRQSHCHGSSDDYGRLSDRQSMNGD